jgi:hypothetical protein
VKRLEQTVYQFKVLRIGEDHRGDAFAEILTPTGKLRLYPSDEFKIIAKTDGLKSDPESSR